MSTLSTSRLKPSLREATLNEAVGGGVLIAVGILSALVLTGHLAPASSTVADALMRFGQFLGAPPADSRVYWYMARSAGVVAYLLLWGSVVAGLMVTNKVLDGAVKPRVTFETHQFLSIAALAFSGFHAFILLGDTYIQFDVADVLIPFRSPYEPGWVGVGILSFYLSALVAGSFYVKKRIGHRAWRLIHFASFAGWIMVTLHGLMAGTDSGTPLMRTIYLVTTLSAAFLTVYRILVMRIKPAPARSN